MKADHKPLVERSGGDERALQLDAKFLRNVSEWRQVVGARSNTLEIAVVERVLGIEQAKHSQHQSAEERVDRGAKVEVGAEEVGSKVGKQRREDVRVLLVELTVGPREHVVKVGRRTIQQLHAEC